VIPLILISCLLCSIRLEPRLARHDLNLERHCDRERFDLRGRNDGGVDAPRGRRHPSGTSADGGADCRAFAAVSDGPDGGAETGAPRELLTTRALLPLHLEGLGFDRDDLVADPRIRQLLMRAARRTR
jgi:hypothetical protein